MALKWFGWIIIFFFFFFFFSSLRSTSNIIRFPRSVVVVVVICRTIWNLEKKYKTQNLWLCHVGMCSRYKFVTIYILSSSVSRTASTRKELKKEKNWEKSLDYLCVWFSLKTIIFDACNDCLLVSPHCVSCNSFFSIFFRLHFRHSSELASNENKKNRTKFHVVCLLASNDVRDKFIVWFLFNYFIATSDDVVG